MRGAGISPDAFTYNSLATAYAKRGRWREALATLAEMSELGFTGDAVSYTAGEILWLRRVTDGSGGRKGEKRGVSSFSAGSRKFI